MKKRYYTFLAVLVSWLAFTACLKEDVNPAEGTPNSFASVLVVRALYKNADVRLEPRAITGAYKMGGVVISDPSGGNFTKGHLVIQNTHRGLTRGLTLALGEAHDELYQPGDSVVVDLTGGTLTRVKGMLQITGLTPASIVKVAEGQALSPKSVAIGDLNANFANYESTLVQVNADLSPLPVPGDTYSGDKHLDDGSGNTIILHTEATAAFAGRRVPASATFIGIPTLEGGSAGAEGVKQLRMRRQADVLNASGPIYPGFPESFETPDVAVKSSYNMNTAEVPNNNLNLKTGNWKLQQAILGNTAGRDRYNLPGLQAIRMQQNLTTPAYVQMNFDLPSGASKVTLWYGTYYTDASSSWQLEYSTDQGATWTKTGDTVTDAGQEARVATFLMDIQVPVRFRVHKLGLGATRVPTVYNGRLSIEDIAIYSN
jgi:hypothetical protein